MKAKEITNGRPAASSSSSDLLVCFPSRITRTMKARLLLEPNKRNPAHKKLLALPSAGSGSRQANSPALQWPKSKTSEIANEPTSPKVTCAGQVKVRPGQPAHSCKDWQSVMHEIERLHKKRKYKRTSSSSSGALWFKKDVMQFITCLRNIRFDFRCFGAFPSSAVDDITSDEEGEEEEEVREVENTEGKDKGDNESSSAAFSKWFMVLQENQNPEIIATEKDSDVNPPCVPPPNALLLMRCRSAPAKSWLKEIQAKEDEGRPKAAENEEDKESATSTNSHEEEEEQEEEEEEEEEDEKEKKKKDMSLVVMGYGENFYKLSSDIAKETWVVAGIRDPLISRSRSCKR